MHSKKKIVCDLLERNDIGGVASIAKKDRKIVSLLVRHAYDKETLVGWRAIEAIGLAARGIIASDRDFLRETCRKLIWSLSDESGGIGWSAPEILGEIASADPKRFKDFIPLIASVYEIEEDVFRGGVLFALGKIAESAPELAAPYQKIIILSLTDKDPIVKVRGLELVGLLWSYSKRSAVWGREYGDRIIATVQNLRMDKGEAWLYRGDNFTSVVVGEEAEICFIKLI
jgi:hypothetical protein